MGTLMTSKIRLCKDINIDRNYVNVTDYSESQMLTLCESSSHLVASANDYSFIRNKGTISTNFNYSDALQSNYIAFQNKDYSNKWFFAWIDEVIYNGEQNTEIKYTIDVWSTWFSYWNEKTCFVVREHVNDDTIGLHTVPENLDIGEVVEEETEEIYLEGQNHDYYYIVMTTYDPVWEDFTGVNKINGNVVGSKLFAFENYDGSVGVANLKSFIKATAKASKLDSIQAIFIAPRSINRKYDINS